MITTTLVNGDPLDPESTDLLAQTWNLPRGEHPGNEHDGWRILTGNIDSNLWGRLAYRYECED